MSEGPAVAQDGPGRQGPVDEFPQHVGPRSGRPPSERGAAQSLPFGSSLSVVRSSHEIPACNPITCPGSRACSSAQFLRRKMPMGSRNK